MKNRASKFRTLLTNRKGMAPVIFVFILIVLGLVGVSALVYISDKVSEPETMAIVPSGELPVSAVECDTTTTPDILINAVDRENPTTAVTDDKNLYRKKATATDDAGVWTSWTLGTSIDDRELFTDYEFLIPGDTTTSNIVAKAFGEYILWNSGCKPESTKQIKVCNDETYDGLAVVWFDADGTPSTAETFAAGVTQTVSAKWSAGAQECFGHPYIQSYVNARVVPATSRHGNRPQYPNVLCLKLNSTAWEVPVWVKLDDGTEMHRVSNPTISAADGATTHVMYCYEFPSVTDTEIKFFMRLEADGTNAPSVDDTAYLYGGNIYINSDTGEPEWGVEDDSGNYVAGNSDADELTLDFV
jgi:hypothetical protein